MDPRELLSDTDASGVSTPRHSDIFSISHAQKYANVHYIEPMVRRMVRTTPASRPSAAEVLQEYRGLRRNVSWVSRFWRLKLRDDYRIVSGVLDLFFVVSCSHGFETARC